MGPFTLIAIYFICWWVVLFVVLPALCCLGQTALGLLAAER